MMTRMAYVWSSTESILLVSAKALKDMIYTGLINRLYEIDAKILV